MSPNVTMYACATCSVRCIEPNGISKHCNFKISQLDLMKVPNDLIEVRFFNVLHILKINNLL